MIDKVLNTIKKHNLINDGENVVAGVSGGPDSVCLLHVLHSLSRELKIKVSAIHVNHMLRGIESENDEEYVRQLCEKLGVTLFTANTDIKKLSRERGISLEEAGREARYGQFESYADSTDAAKIAVAHNKNDQVETVLMHIIRGTGLEGLKGMDYKRGRIIRPLLDFSREEIEDYCSKHSLHPRIDSSNLKSVYTRNKIRLDLIPYINGLFGTNIIDSVYKMSSLLREDNEFIRDSTAKLYDQSALRKREEGVWLDLSKLKKYHAAIIKRVIRSALKEVKGDLTGIESIHVEDITNLGLNGRTGSEIHLPCNIRARKSYDILKIFLNQESGKPEGFNMQLNIPGITPVETAGLSIEAFVEEKQNSYRWYVNEQNSLMQFFDYEKIKMGISIRTRKEGDIFKPYRSNGTKKLKEYLIDNKIPHESRDQIPLIAVQNEIVWVIGYKTSDKFKVTENTKNVLKLKIQFEGELCRGK